MAMNRSGHRPAGGLHSRNVRHTSAPKVEPKAYGRNPAAVAQYGALVGNHRTTFGGSETRYRGEPDTMKRGYQTPYGITDPVKAVGVGGGRDVHLCGGQGTHGATSVGHSPISSLGGARSACCGDGRSPSFVGSRWRRPRHCEGEG